MGSLSSVALAGGGTGGHLFPGIAVARELRRRCPETRLLFIGAAGRLEERAVPAAGFDFHGLKMKGIVGTGTRERAAGLLLAAAAVRRSRRVLAAFGADLVVGVGGFASGPAGVAAWSLGVPLVLLEQNTVPGLTNRLLGRLARQVFVAFEPARRFFPAGRAVVTGNPVRPEALADAGPVGGGRGLRLLVLGGSRGAAGLNRLVREALPALAPLQERLAVVHQSGMDDRGEVAAAYRAAGVRAEVRAFIDDMAAAYGAADLVVSRAGAGAVSEIAANGRPAILVPFPHAAGRHQHANAGWLAGSGGAAVVDETEPEASGKLAALVTELDRDRERLRSLADGSRRAGIRDAAGRIVTRCEELVAPQGR